jgi:ABC-2 type transport system permease protein
VNIKRTLAITKKTFRGIWSDKAALMLLLVTPALSIVVFAFGFGGDVSHVRVAVVNQDEGYQIPPSRVRVSISGAILANLDSEVVEVDEVATEAEGVRLVESADAYGVIVFPKDFTRNVYEKSLPGGALSLDTTIRVKLDKTNVRVAGVIREAMGDALVGASASMGVEGPATLDTSDAIYGESATMRDFFLPAIATYILYIETFLMVVQVFVGQRISGSLARLQVTPLRPSEFVVGNAIAYSVLGIMQAAIMLTFSVYVFGIACEGSMLLAFLVIGVLAVMSLSMGMMLSSLARRSEQAMASISIVALPSFLVSGIFWPVEAIPTWLRPLSYVVPNTYAVNAARDVMLQGWGIGQIWLELVVLAAFTVLFLALSAFSLGRVRG